MTERSAQIQVADRGDAVGLSGQDLDGQSAVASPSMRGKPIVVTVWGSWCADCHRESPYVVAAAEGARLHGPLRRHRQPRPRHRPGARPSRPATASPGPRSTHRAERRCSPSPALITPNSVPVDRGARRPGPPGRRASTAPCRPPAPWSRWSVRWRRVAEWFQQQASSGSLVLAIPVALVAGLVSFFSPCVIPLLPGYLSYATGPLRRRPRARSPRPDARRLDPLRARLLVGLRAPRVRCPARSAAGWSTGGSSSRSSSASSPSCSDWPSRD